LNVALTRNMFNMTPIETASKSGHDNIVQLMLKYVE